MATEMSSVPDAVPSRVPILKLSAWNAGVCTVMLGIMVIFIALVRYVWVTTVDDSFITMRYATHLAEGYGPTWNINGPPVEGYTTFLWMIILTLPVILGIDPLLFAKSTGVVCTFAIFALTFWAVDCSTEKQAGWQRVVPAMCTVGLLVAFAPTTIHAVTGMETALFTCLLTAYFVVLAVVFQQPGRVQMHVAAVLGLLVGLTRPEGNVAVGAAAAMAILLLPRDRRWQMIGSLLCLYIVPGILYMSWRVWYYQSLFPLPFLVKAVHQGLFAGRADVLDFVVYILLRIGILLGLGLFRIKRAWYPALVGSLIFGSFWLFPAHVMGYNWRFLYPIVPIIVIIAAHGLMVIKDLGERVFRSASATFRYLPLGVAIVVPVFSLGWDAPPIFTMPVVEGRGLQSAHGRLGKSLAAFSEAHPTMSPVLAIGDAGAVPYYSRWHTIDHFGLNDSVIARSGKHDPAYVLDQHPDVVVLVSRSTTTFRPQLAYEDALHDEVIARGMVRVQVLTYLPDRYYLWVFVQPQSALADYFSQLPETETGR